MAFISDYLENKLVDHVFRGNTYVAPSTIYVALFSGDPGEDGSGPELLGGGYARKSATFGAPSNGVSHNDADVTFDPATSDWPAITHIGLYDDVSTGNLLFYGPLSSSVSIDSGNNFRLPAGNLAIGFD
jgi:hypothetical protein